MHKIDIVSLFSNWKFDYGKFIDKTIEIGDVTAIRQLKNAKYRRNYERGLLLLAASIKFNSKRFLEFGTGRGFASACVGLTDHNIEIFTIDNKSTEESKSLLDGLGIGAKIHFIKSDSNKVKNLIQFDFDLIFIDGGHDYKSVKNDFKISVEKCKRGLIIFDDFRNKHSGIKKFIKQLKFPRLLVNSDGWIFENKLIHEAGDADKILDNKETASGQVIVPISITMQELING